jgi:hypothetical protein
LTSFIALYQGDTVASSRILAITADPLLVSDFADRLLDDWQSEPIEHTITPVEEANKRRQRITTREEKRRPTAGQEQVRREDGTIAKEDSANDCIVPQT